MITETYNIMPFTSDHISGALGLSQAAGWPHRAEDWAMLLSVSKGMVAMDGDQIVATALVTPYGDVATVNMIIVDEKARGKGLGRKIMASAMALISPHEWRLIATVSGRPLYEKMGFKVTGEIMQLQGHSNPLSTHEISGDDLSWATLDDMDNLLMQDWAATGLKRYNLFKYFGKMAKVVVLNGHNGFGVLRDFGQGQVIGPVVAKSIEDAKKIYSFLLNTSAGVFVRTDVLGNENLSIWLEQQGLERVDQPISMAYGSSGSPKSDLEVFAITSQALA